MKLKTVVVDVYFKSLVKQFFKSQEEVFMILKAPIVIRSDFLKISEKIQKLQWQSLFRIVVDL